ncbi:NYN domain-containing protein [Achromobacter xylosoxidans]|uniref:NYN domain-containing protein n=1 Tax=Alcaligenes xylosoxydans xylosoxydans TaxID=85698 RepID=UPI0006C3452A|nr:NYN domain-containing protein [Achromobacter xylosoxidans]CUJ41496.1 NYN domain [Achromobacter xylosoxidans]
MPGNICTIFWDNSNIFVTAKDEARDREGATAGRDLRIHFQNLLDLARAGRTIHRAFGVGSQPPELQAVWDRLRTSGVSLELYERGQDSGHEQALDQALQVHMLRATLDGPPNTAVLLTGDGAGFHNGIGFHADLERMHKHGWAIEVISWERACHPRLKSWAEAVGTFVRLEDHYDSVTFLEKLRRQTSVKRRPISPFPPILPGTHK